jgi:hypothetical protein
MLTAKQRREIILARWTSSARTLAKEYDCEIKRIYLTWREGYALGLLSKAPTVKSSQGRECARRPSRLNEIMDELRAVPRGSRPKGHIS